MYGITNLNITTGNHIIVILLLFMSFRRDNYQEGKSIESKC